MSDSTSNMLELGLKAMAAIMQLLPITANGFLAIKAILATDLTAAGADAGLVDRAIGTNEANIANLDAWLAAHPKAEPTKPE